MTLAELIALRKALGLTQEEMATQIGLSHRAYQRIEAGESALRTVHTQATERAALRHAIARRDPMLAPAAIRRDALDLARLITGERAA
jgi:transcriptional regulator with XRE-family HTH domain